MTSQHDTTEPVDRDDADWYSEQLSIALDALRACYAVLRYANDNLEHGIGHRPGGSDALRIAEASDQLRALLAIPGEREGAWEAQHVDALADELRGVLAVLEEGVDR